MLKLQTLLELQENINQETLLLERLKQDYLDLIDDDLWTVDLEAKPSYTNDDMITFITERKLKNKYINRFCSDFGLTLVSEKEKSDKTYSYIFQAEKI